MMGQKKNDNSIRCYFTSVNLLVCPSKEMMLFIQFLKHILQQLVVFYDKI